MNFQELVDEVIAQTTRPDMGLISNGGDGRIPRAILAATYKLHCLDYFFKDIQPARIVFDAAGYVQTLDTSVLPRYRSMAYIRKYDPSIDNSQLDPNILPPLYNNVGAVNPTQSMAFLDPITPAEVLDSYGSERLDVYYQAGDTVFIKTSSSITQALFGWYRFPNIDSSNNYANYDSFIAREFPYAITFSAVAAIYSAIGKQDQARKLESPYNPKTGEAGEVWMHVMALKRSNILVQGS